MEPRRHLRQRGHAARDLVPKRVTRVRSERRAAAEEEGDQGTNRIQVRRGSGGRPQELLGRSEEPPADESVAPWPHRVRQTAVEEEDLALGRHQNVARVEPAVGARGLHARVQGSQTFGNLPPKQAHQARIHESPRRRLTAQLCQIHPGLELACRIDLSRTLAQLDHAHEPCLVESSQPARGLDKACRQMRISAPAFAPQQGHHESALVRVWLRVGQPGAIGFRGPALPQQGLGLETSKAQHLRGHRPRPLMMATHAPITLPPLSATASRLRRPRHPSRWRC